LYLSMAEDKSRKGEIDSPIRDMIDEINIDPKMSTTSSCSGRIVVYQKLENIRKTNCNWLLVLHEPINLEQLQDSLRNVTTGGIVFAKFEPFILHCQCADMETARCLLICGLNSGFRESGIVVGKNDRFTVAIRSSQIMEVPLTNNSGKVIVPDEYLDQLVSLLNQRMQVTAERRDKFLTEFRNRFRSSKEQLEYSVQ
ncbi:hypothetical protein BOX15_Mlig005776g5, partial [Macrostomum lignano]